MLGDKIIRIAFIISLAGHCLFLGIPGFNLSSFQDIKASPEITVKIEVEKPSLLPRIDIMGQEKKLKEVIEKPSLEFKPEPKEKVVLDESLKDQVKEDIEIIDPAQEAMLRYQDMVKQRIEQVRRYPSWAKRQEIEGVAYLNFIISPNGFCRDIRTIHSSGSRVLDEEAIQTVKRANPFPPIPQQLNQGFVSMEVAIVFKMK